MIFAEKRKWLQACLCFRSLPHKREPRAVPPTHRCKTTWVPGTLAPVSHAIAIFGM